MFRACSRVGRIFGSSRPLVKAIVCIALISSFDGRSLLTGSDLGRFYGSGSVRCSWLSRAARGRLVERRRYRIATADYCWSLVLNCDRLQLS